MAPSWRSRRIPNRLQKRNEKESNVEGLLERILKNLRRWRLTWKQVGTKIEAEIDVIFERRFLKKPCSFGKMRFFDPVDRSWEHKSIKNRCKKRCGKGKARKFNFDRFLTDLGGQYAQKSMLKWPQNLISF